MRQGGRRCRIVTRNVDKLLKDRIEVFNLAIHEWVDAYGYGVHHFLFHSADTEE